MSDLISRKSLKDRASEYALSSDEYNRFCKIIDGEPTAYDTDEIINELDNAKEKIATEEYCKNIIDTGNCENKDCFKCCAEYLINIVKRGNVMGEEN